MTRKQHQHNKRKAATKAMQKQATKATKNRNVRVKCDVNDDAMKIILKMTMTLTTLWITTTVMMITTMAKAVALFFLS